MSGKESGPIVTRDEDYYLHDVIFRVENRLFKVPIRHLTEVSDVFRAMFELPQEEKAADAEGTSDENPIFLEGVKSGDFKQLLQVLFASRYSKLDGLTLENWCSVLKLSSKWDMTDVREHAITRIWSMIKDDPRTQLLWGQTYDIEKWIYEGASSLVNRPDAMNEEDVQKLGVQTTLKIAKIREDLKNRTVTEYYIFSSYGVRQSVEGKMKFETEERIRAEFGVLDADPSDSKGTTGTNWRHRLI